jgi:hypothetical protein
MQKKVSFNLFASLSEYFLVIVLVALGCCGCNQISTPRETEPRVLSKVEMDSVNYEKMRAASGKNDSTVLSYYGLSTKLGRKSSETLSEAASRLMENQKTSPNREAGVKALIYMKNKSEISAQFAEEFYKSQVEVLIKIEKAYPLDWKNMIKGNYGQRILDIHLRNRK